ncbi:MAG: acetate/propionate family kinase [Candidatus Kapaibacterium sp.]|jgi:acetate kinase
MNILVLNCGSSSLKFQIIETDSEKIKTNSDKELAKGVIEKVGTNEAIISIKAPGNENYKAVMPVLDHKIALNRVIDWIKLPTTHINGVKCLQDIHAIGHRTVHGTEHFNSSIKITKEVVDELEANIEIAPLHNPANLKGIEAAIEVFGKDIPQVAIFDTAFHLTLPKHAFMYAIPLKYYNDYKIRKYGFHGTSHRYIAIRYRQLTNKTIEETNIISLHLGNGASTAAIKHGKSIDTTMGFTPLEGLMMGTRSGNLDPTVLEFIMKKENLSISEAITILNKKSGVLGISGISNDMRDLAEAVEKRNDENAKLALEMYAYRNKKYIGAYLAAMNGADAICFTAGIGENAPDIRRDICSGLESLGIEIDDELNKQMVGGKEGIISKPTSKIKICVIPTNEELMLARDTYCIVSGIDITE